MTPERGSRENSPVVSWHWRGACDGMRRGDRRKHEDRVEFRTVSLWGRPNLVRLAPSRFAEGFFGYGRRILGPGPQSGGGSEGSS